MPQGELDADSIVGCLLLCASSFAQAAEPTLEVTAGEQTRSFSRDQLLARPDATTIEVPNDITYREAITYRAVPVAAPSARLEVPAGSVIETVATRRFHRADPV